jgi:hypothetical protein
LSLVSFRTFFFLAAFLNSGAAFAQTQFPTCSNSRATPVFIRAEGNSEQVADISFDCTSFGGTSTVFVFLSLPVTSVALGSGGLTEATLITSAGSTRGSVAGNLITFSNVQLPLGSSTLTVTNLRVDAAANGAFLTAITGSAVVSTAINNVSENTVIPSATVANAVPGIAPALGAQTFSSCAVMTSASGAAFLVRINENFPTAFKTAGGPANGSLGSEFTGNTETGYYGSTGGSSKSGDFGNAHPDPLQWGAGRRLGIRAGSGQQWGRGARADAVGNRRFLGCLAPCATRTSCRAGGDLEWRR